MGLFGPGSWAVGGVMRDRTQGHPEMLMSGQEGLWRRTWVVKSVEVEEFLTHSDERKNLGECPPGKVGRASGSVTLGKGRLQWPAVITGRIQRLRGALWWRGWEWGARPRTQHRGVEGPVWLGCRAWEGDCGANPTKRGSGRGGEPEPWRGLCVDQSGGPRAQAPRAAWSCDVVGRGACRGEGRVDRS